MLDTLTKSPLAFPPIREAAEIALRFPNDLKFIRETLGINQSTLARKLGVNRNHILYWEQGKHEPRRPLIFEAVRLWAERLREAQQ